AQGQGHEYGLGRQRLPGRAAPHRQPERDRRLGQLHRLGVFFPTLFPRRTLLAPPSSWEGGAFSQRPLASNPFFSFPTRQEARPACGAITNEGSHQRSLGETMVSSC